VGLLPLLLVLLLLAMATIHLGLLLGKFSSRGSNSGSRWTRTGKLPWMPAWRVQ
jgi:amino acid permease